MLSAVRSKTPKAPVFVEGNAEDKIGVVYGTIPPAFLIFKLRTWLDPFPSPPR